MRGGAHAAFGGDEKFASERGSHQPRSPSQAERIVAEELRKGKKSCTEDAIESE